MKLRRVYAALLTCAICLPAIAEAQAPANQKIQAKNGDLILVENADRVRIVRRREGQVRAIFSQTERWLVLLLDQGSAGAPPDGLVDATYKFFNVWGDWPFGDRWDGRGAIEEYSIAGEQGTYGLGLSTPAGTIQFLGAADQIFRDTSSAGMVSYGGAGRSATRGMTFDMAEQQQVAQSSRGAATQTNAPGTVPPGGPMPVRVGGNIRVPTKLFDVRPVYPEEARAARISGMVILEAIIGVDGTVSEARVVRSIPALDAAALDAVNQWRFEPTLLNGVPVPVIMTVTVNFALQ